MGFNNLLKMLDEGKIKSIPEVKMTKLGKELFMKYQAEEAGAKYTMMKYHYLKDEYDEWRKKMDEWEYKCSQKKYDTSLPEAYRVPNGYPPEKPRPSYSITCDEYKKAKDFTHLGDKYSPGLDNFLYKYYNIRPFEPWVMINISPDWAGKEITPTMVEDLISLVRSYMKEEWYSEWHYAIESGGEGNHLHTHIVAKLNQDRIKSVKSHLSKGNHVQQLKKYSNKIKGLQGLIKGPGIQRVLINNEEILQDKMDYLHEAEKPEGHKNKKISVNCNFRIHGCL